ncbi:MAG: hypothetical protein ABI321_09945 [Polyangia bacterium]
MKPSLGVWGPSLFLILSSLPVGGRASAAPGQTIALAVTGPASNAGKVRRCEDVARAHGFGLSYGAPAPVQVTLQLMSGYNRLIVTSARRGQIVDTPRPGWGMQQLCEDAMQFAERAYGAEGQPAVAPQPQYAQPQYAQPQQYVAPQGGAPVLALDVTGPAANAGKQDRCLRVAQRRGVVINPSASFRVMLVLGQGPNRLQITSARGELYNQPKPGWGMEQLCEDAINQATLAWSQGGAAPAPQPQPQYAPPPQPAAPKHSGYALGPIPPARDLPSNVKALAEGGVKAWQAAQFDAALTAFREAYRIGSDPQFLFDQAVCEQRLAHFSEALSHTQQYLDRAPQSAYRPYADQLFSELQGAVGNE